MKVLGMGNALVDVLATIDDDKVLNNLQLPKGSMQLIDKRRYESLSNEINKLKTSIVAGGSASNTIAGLAYLGIETGFVGRIGKDTFGEYFRKDLEKHHVSPVLSVVDEPTGVATTFISRDGQRTFGTYLGAAALLDPDDLKQDYFTGYDYFYIEGYLVQNYDLIRKAIIMAKEAGAKVILDFASYNIVAENKDFLLEILPQYVDIVFANEEETNALFPFDTEKAVSMLAQSVDIAIVKTGAKGSWIQQGNIKYQIPARKVNCIDTTGAGDLYASGFLYGLINNLPLNTSGEIGTLLAANVIQTIGARIEERNWSIVFKEIKQLTT